jgi:YtcA-like protein
VTPGGSQRVMRYGSALVLPVLAGCARAPSFDILGSFFPAWLLCAVIAVLLTVLSRGLLRRYVELAWPVLVYPSLTALFAFALWLALFS